MAMIMGSGDKSRRAASHPGKPRQADGSNRFWVEGDVSQGTPDARQGAGVLRSLVQRLWRRDMRSPHGE